MIDEEDMYDMLLDNSFDMQNTNQNEDSALESFSDQSIMTDYLIPNQDVDASIDPLSHSSTESIHSPHSSSGCQTLHPSSSSISHLIYLFLLCIGGIIRTLINLNVDRSISKYMFRS